MQRFASALRRFPDSADLHNELGFTHRRLRRMDKAFEHYRRALELDPQHRGAHEYIGEAYLMVNNLPKAKEHLAALDKLCFFGCSEYTELKKAIAAYEAKAK